MVIRAITKYVSEDGTEHESIEEARRYDAMFKGMSAIKSALQKASPTNSLGTIHIDIANNPNNIIALRDALNTMLTYHRNYGKLKPKT